MSGGALHPDVFTSVTSIVKTLSDTLLAALTRTCVCSSEALALHVHDFASLLHGLQIRCLCS